MAGFSAFPMISLCVTIPMRRRDRRIWINDENRTITICTLRFLSPFRHPKGAYLASDVRYGLRCSRKSRAAARSCWPAEGMRFGTEPKLAQQRRHGQRRSSVISDPFVRIQPSRSR